MNSFLRDSKYALRLLTANAGFTAIAVLTLALGIGVSTVVFSVVDAVLIKPLPYSHSNRIVVPRRLAPVGLDATYTDFPWGRAEFEEFARETKTFEAMGAFEYGSFNLTGQGDPMHLNGVQASAGFFPSLG